MNKTLNDINNLKSSKLYFFQMRVFVFFVLIFFLGESVFSQNFSEDSIINPEAFKSAKNIADKAKNLSKKDINLSILEYNKSLKIASENGFKFLEGEILYFQAKNFLQLQNIDTAVSLFLKSATIRREVNDYLGLHKSLSNVCAIYYEKGLLKEGLLLVKESEEAAVRADYTRGIGIAKLQKGNFLLNLARYDEALESYQAASDYFKLIEYFDGVGMCLNNIASIYLTQENFPKALEYYMLNLNIQKKTGNSTEYAHAAANLGTYYSGFTHSPAKNNRQNIDSMFYYFNLASKLYTEQNNTLHIVKTTTNLGAANILINNFSKATELLNLSEKLAIDENFQVELARIYRMKGILFQKSRKYRDSEKSYLEALEMFSSLKLREEEMMTCFEIAVTYDSLELYKNSVKYYKKFISLNDTLRGKESQRFIEQMTAKYDSKLKDEQIELAKIREKDLEEKNQAQAKFNAILKIAIIIVALFLSIVIYFFVQNRKSNKLLTRSNVEILKQKEIIEEQKEDAIHKNQLLTQSNEEITQQKEIIELKERETTESIEYARNIQFAMLPSNELINQLFGNSCFIMFNPKKIVSGDFYWCAPFNNKKIFAAVDCTGHGVPGAFMSMLGISFLNEIVINAESTIHSNDILNKLRQHIIKSLRQKGISGEQQDGMDMALGIYDESTRELDFSGAKNPLIIVRKGNHSPIEENERIEYHEFISSKNNEHYTILQLIPNKMPVGIDVKTDSFFNTTITLEPQDAVYVFSDGFQDQFGGAKNKKFMIKQLKQTFVDIHELDMKKQQKHLQDIFTNWKGEEEQTDDVLVMGIKVL